MNIFYLIKSLMLGIYITFISCIYKNDFNALVNPRYFGKSCIIIKLNSHICPWVWKSSCLHENYLLFNYFKNSWIIISCICRAHVFQFFKSKYNCTRYLGWIAWDDRAIGPKEFYLWLLSFWYNSMYQCIMYIHEIIFSLVKGFHYKII